MIVNELYERWNEALAERFFDEVEPGSPAYLAVDDDVLDELVADVERTQSATDGSASLADAVQRTLG